eukprot:267262-Prymnesium_polylepis.1
MRSGASEAGRSWRSGAAPLPASSHPQRASVSHQVSCVRRREELLPRPRAVKPYSCMVTTSDHPRGNPRIS